MKIAITAIAAFAGITTASPYFSSANGHQGIGSAPAGNIGPTITIDLSGLNSWDLLGDPDNVHLSALIFANAQVVGIGWDVYIQTAGTSWLSEASMNFQDAVFLTPGIGSDAPGSESFSSGGILDLIALGLDFVVGADGMVNIELFETFDDVDGSIDAVYGVGSTIQVQFAFPAPGGLAALGLGGLVAGRRRR